MAIFTPEILLSAAQCPSVCPAMAAGFAAEPRALVKSGVSVCPYSVLSSLSSSSDRASVP